MKGIFWQLSCPSDLCTVQEVCLNSKSMPCPWSVLQNRGQGPQHINIAKYIQSRFLMHVIEWPVLSTNRKFFPLLKIQFDFCKLSLPFCGFPSSQFSSPTQPWRAAVPNTLFIQGGSLWALESLPNLTSAGNGTLNVIASKWKLVSL